MPTNAGPVRIAIFDDTCGNFVQLVQMTGKQHSNDFNYQSAS